MSNIQLNKTLIYILKIPDIIYSPKRLRVTLMKHLNRKLYNSYNISIELQTFLNEPNDYIDLDKLISIIITNYCENTNKPNCDYYSYDQNPNFTLINTDTK